MLSGMGEVGASMFETLAPRAPGPDPATLAAAAAAAKTSRKVELREVVARTYDLSKDKDLAQYTYDMECLVIGTQARTHVVLNREPLKFVESGGCARYIAHLQWAEYELITTPIESVPSADAQQKTRKGKTKDGKQQ